MPRPVHFEFQAHDPEQMQKFYTDVFEWKFDKWNGPEPYWLITTGTDGEPGINGGMLKSRGLANTVNSVQVPNLDHYMERVKTAGGEIVVPKTAIPGVGWLAYGKDPEGNIFGMTQMDPAAK